MGRVVGVLAAGVVLLSTIGVTTADHAGAATPTISLTPTSLPSSGGYVTPTASTTGLSSCSITSTPAIAGLPTCATPLPWPNISVPANNTKKPVTYKFTFSGTCLFGCKGSFTAKAVIVTVAPPAPATYVALGDSFAAGEGNPAKSPNSWVDFAGNPTSVDDGCDRSAVSNAVLTSKWLKKHGSSVSPPLPSMSLTFPACSGATTGDLWNSNAQSAGLMPASGDKGEPQQITNNASALANARIVTVMIGGNDFNFGGILSSCVLFGCGPGSADAWVANASQNIAKLEPILASTYSQIEAAAPNAALYVIGYPHIFPTSSGLVCMGNTGIAPAGMDYLASFQDQLTAVIQSAATATGAHFVDPNSSSVPYSFAGHDICSHKPYFNNLNLTTQQYSFHPNKWGQAALAADVEAAIATNSSPSAPPKLTGVTSVASDAVSHCAILNSGGVDCWGANFSGDLGDGSTVDSAFPVQVSGLAHVASVVGIGFQNGYCALLQSGGVECWGDNSWGQIGNGVTGGPGCGGTCFDTPQTVTGISNAISISATFYSYCALLRTGSVDCWGSNSEGEIGNGSGSFPGGCGPGPCFNTPQQVVSISTATSVTSGGEGFCALLSSGAIKCWGNNGLGELGNGTLNGPDCGNGCNQTPQDVIGITDASAVVSDWDYGYCALLKSGGIECWGNDQTGQMGNGTGSSGTPGCGSVNAALAPYCFDTPQSVSGISTATSVAPSGGGVGDAYGDGNAYCAVLTSGSVECWGDNHRGIIGNGTVGGPGCGGTCYTAPQQVSNITTATSVSSDGQGFCAFLTDWTLSCWGVNDSGQVGNGVAGGPDCGGECIPSPQPVTGVTATEVSPTFEGGYCAIIPSGTLDCWGRNAFDDLGAGFTGPFSATPVAILA